MNRTLLRNCQRALSRYLALSRDKVLKRHSVWLIQFTGTMACHCVIILIKFSLLLF